jgi:acyl-CoA dehydrogenase
MKAPRRSAGIGVASRASMFLADTDNPGWHPGPRMRTIDASTAGSHCRDHGNVLVTQDSVLGEPGRGFARAQLRLAPARPTHCTRWLGAARRARHLATRGAAARDRVGAPLAPLGMDQELIADNEIDLAACRALLW